MLIAVVPIVLVGAFIFDHERDVLSDNALHDLNRVADLQEARLDAVLQRRDGFLMTAARRAARELSGLRARPSAGATPTFDEMLQSEVAQAEGVRSLTITDLDGVVRNSSDASTVGDAVDATTQGMIASAVPMSLLVESLDGELIHRCTAPIVVGSEVIGAVVMDATTDEIADIATDFQLLGETGETTIAQHDPTSGLAQVVAPRRFDPGELLPFSPDPATPLAAALDGRSQRLTGARDYRDATVFAVTRPIEGTSWGMVVKIDRDEALAEIDELRTLVLAAGAIAAAMAVCAAWFMADRLTRPLASLTQTAREIARGDRSRRADVHGSPEMHELADAFNRMAESLEDHAVTDALTRLPNRDILTNRLDRALVRARRHHTVVAVLFCDIDGFKMVNDAMGHGAGDLLLQQFAIRLRDACEADQLACRFGGDEFVVVLERVDSVHLATMVAQRILEQVSGPVEIGGRSHHVTVSIGVATSDGGTSGEELLSDADAAMYLAKERGKARVESFDTGLRNSVETRLSVDRALRKSLPTDDIEVHYQPIVDLADGRVVRAEALVRWRRDGVLVGPAEFLSVAAESTLVVDLGDVVLERVARDLARLPDDFGVNVNLSARELLDSTLAARLAGYLDRHGVRPNRLCVEVTEDAVFTDLDRIVGVLHELRSLGVTAAIDDFGTGYSSLSHVRSIPSTVLKIDQTFVAGVAMDPDDAQIAQLVVSLGTQLGMTVVAEGIETDEQLATLRGMGCEFGQGYYFSRPVPIDHLAASIGGLRRRQVPLRARRSSSVVDAEQ